MGKIAAGMPSWVDLGSPDVEASKRFYAELFGWTSTVATEPEAFGYTTFHKDGKAVAAVGGLMSEEQPPAWTTYFATEDADSTAARVESAGGKVLAPPMDIMGYGRMATFMDPTGAAFGVWQPGSMTGEDVSGVPGSRGWNELMTRDPKGSKTFYASTLGWSARDVGFDGGTYTLFKVGETSAGGMMPMEGDMWPADLPPHWMVYFEVDDCDAAAARAAGLGATVSVQPSDTDAGRFAVLSDPQGAFFSIIKSNPDYKP